MISGVLPPDTGKNEGLLFISPQSLGFCSSSLSGLRQNSLVVSTPIVRIVAPWALFPLLPKAQEPQHLWQFGAVPVWMVGWSGREKPGRTGCDCFKITSLSSHLYTQGGGVHPIGFIRISLLETRAIKWLAHYEKFQMLKDGALGFPSGCGPEPGPVHLWKPSQLGTVEVCGAVGGPFLVSPRNPTYFSPNKLPCSSHGLLVGSSNTAFSELRALPYNPFFRLLNTATISALNRPAGRYCVAGNQGHPPASKCFSAHARVVRKFPRVCLTTLHAFT